MRVLLSTYGSRVRERGLSAMGGYVLIKLVHAAEWLWHRYRKPAVEAGAAHAHAVETHVAPTRKATFRDFVPDPSRRSFFRTASVVAGAAPFVGVIVARVVSTVCIPVVFLFSTAHHS